MLLVDVLEACRGDHEQGNGDAVYVNGNSVDELPPHRPSPM